MKKSKGKKPDGIPAFKDLPTTSSRNPAAAPPYPDDYDLTQGTKPGSDASASAPSTFKNPSPAEAVEMENFKNQVPLQKVGVDYDVDRLWNYYDAGPKDSKVAPLICLPPVTGGVDTYYRQILALSARGYRVISAAPPPYWSLREMLGGLDAFTRALKIKTFHLLGSSLGGFQAQAYAEYRPNRVLSLILVNAFIDNRPFYMNSPNPSLYWMTPGFMLKRFLLANLPSHKLDAPTAFSVDFMVNQIEKLSQKEVASRLTLNCTPYRIGELELDPARITLIESMTGTALPPTIREQLHKARAGAKEAFLKTGGNFPYLAAPDEFNMHLVVHLRANANAVPPVIATVGPDAEAASEDDEDDYDEDEEESEDEEDSDHEAAAAAEQEEDDATTKDIKSKDAAGANSDDK